MYATLNSRAFTIALWIYLLPFHAQSFTSLPSRTANYPNPILKHEPSVHSRMSMSQPLTAIARVLPSSLVSPTVQSATLVTLTAAVLVRLGILALDRPSRPYSKEENSVGKEYDAWCEQGILEHLWGEHIHLGYYSTEERKRGSFRKDIIEAKYDFIDKMMDWGGVSNLIEAGDIPERVLDVGCGIGGTSRYLAKKLGERSMIEGITLSQKQVERATELADQSNIKNCEFKVMDALKMDYPDNSFDLVWACESGEHMPDKKLYVEEMTRVLKPGGRIVIATWCQRDDSVQKFTPAEEKKLDFLYSEWTHPHFISIKDYAKIMKGTGSLENIETDNWTKETIASWRHSIWMGIKDPLPWMFMCGLKLSVWLRTIKDAWCIERMHQAFKKGLMEYGMMTAVKKR